MVDQTGDAVLSQEVVIVAVLDDEGVLAGFRFVVLEVWSMPHHLGSANTQYSQSTNAFTSHLLVLVGHTLFLYDTDHG